MTTTNLYRIHNDSSHFVGIKYIKKDSKKPIENNEARLKDFKSEFCLTYGTPKNKGGRSSKKSEIDKMFYEAYLKALEFKKKERVNIMVEYLKNNNIIVPIEMVEKYLKTKYDNLRLRIDRFKKKALNNKWNYFVTITYDDTKHDEESFKTKLKKCLANLHTRNGYKYMGVFERSKSGRLHFHALMYIPKSEMKGELKTIKDYSTSDNKMRITTINTFFESRFGRNDFTKINSKDLMKDNTIEYLLKYISKSDEPIFYSRGIPTYLYVELSNDEVVSQFGEMLIKYVFYDDILEHHNLINMRC